MKIAEVSERFGISPDTLRYYERLGLLPEAPRPLKFRDPVRLIGVGMSGVPHKLDRPFRPRAVLGVSCGQMTTLPGRGVVATVRAAHHDHVQTPAHQDDQSNWD